MTLDREVSTDLPGHIRRGCANHKLAARIIVTVNSAVDFCSYDALQCHLHCEDFCAGGNIPPISGERTVR